MIRVFKSEKIVRMIYQVFLINGFTANLTIPTVIKQSIHPIKHSDINFLRKAVELKPNTLLPSIIALSMLNGCWHSVYSCYATVNTKYRGWSSKFSKISVGGCFLRFCSLWTTDSFWCFFDNDKASFAIRSFEKLKTIKLHMNVFFNLFINLNLKKNFLVPKFFKFSFFFLKKKKKNRNHSIST